MQTMKRVPPPPKPPADTDPGTHVLQHPARQPFVEGLSFWLGFIAGILFLGGILLMVLF